LQEKQQELQEKQQELLAVMGRGIGNIQGG